MFRNNRKNNKKHCVRLLGPILISLGAGIFLANLIPAYMLIIIFGIALIAAGVWFVMK